MISRAIDRLLPSSASARERVVDAALVAVLGLLLVAELWQEEKVVGALVLPVGLLACGVLLFRRSRPTAVLTVAVAAHFAIAWSTGLDRAMFPVVLAALYAATRYGHRAHGLLTATAAAVTVAVGAAVFDDDPFLVELVEEGAQTPPSCSHRLRLSSSRREVARDGGSRGENTDSGRAAADRS